jgi:hypothetical protein
MSSLFLPIARHIVAIAVAWLGTALALTDVQITDLETALTAAALVIFAGLWTVVEKALKPLTRRFLGEKQAGDTAPLGDR